MPSTFVTDPLGPRSVDEMLDLVYDRAERVRRRRTMQRLGSGVAVLALSIGAVVALGPGDDSAQLRVVDDPGGRHDTPAPDPTPGGGVEHAADAPSRAPERPNASAPPAAPPTTMSPGAPPVTSLPQVATESKPSLELWKQVGDVEHDSVPDDWYYDIVSASMELDRAKSVVVFTTRYRSPDGSTDAVRATRQLESTFDYGTHSYVVTVTEADNRLGGVRVDDADEACSSCSARFDAASATLVVTVPLGVLNDAVARHDDSPPLGSGAAVADLTASTKRIDAPVEADVSGQGRLG